MRLARPALLIDIYRYKGNCTDGSNNSCLPSRVTIVRYRTTDRRPCVSVITARLMIVRQVQITGWDFPLPARGYLMATAS